MATEAYIEEIRSESSHAGNYGTRIIKNIAKSVFATALEDLNFWETLSSYFNQLPLSGTRKEKEAAIRMLDSDLFFEF